MFKKASLFLLVFSLVLVAYAQEAEDIIVPEGYKVEKIVDTNDAYDVMGMCFDSAGNIIAGSNAYFIFRIDPLGHVEPIAQTRRYPINPQIVKISSIGEYIIKSSLTYYPTGIYRFTPPNQFELLISPNSFSSMEFDNKGNFYVIQRDPVTNEKKICRYDSDYQEVETIFQGYIGFQDLVFDSENNMFLVEYRSPGTFESKIWKITAGDDGYVGHDDLLEVYVEGLDGADVIGIDESDVIYVGEWYDTVIDGFSKDYIYRLTKVDTNKNIYTGVVMNLAGTYEILCKDGYIFVSEFDKSLISKIDAATFIKEPFTPSHGITAAGPVAFDADDNLYTHGFRELRLFRLNNEGTFDQVGQGTGYAQSIVTDGTYFYMGSYDIVTGNRYQVIKVDPISETTEVIATQLGGWRSVAFDTYGRLLLNTIIDGNQNLYGLDIIDLNTGEVTPYLTGLHNKERCIQFDSDNNVYFVEGIGEGIKKVWLDENYDPPRDVSFEPLFYDFRDEPYPPTIYFFYVNHLKEVFIPQMETGEILRGYESRIVEVFAEGFLSPTQVTFDKYGSMYVSDMGNGLFKITYVGWTVPAIIALIDKMLMEIQDSDIQEGVKNSLVSKLENADKDLEKEKILPAIYKINAFKNEVLAQRGKKIPVDLADSWILTAKKIMDALNEILED